MNILDKIKNKTVNVGIVGMGYVGLPLGLAFTAKNINVLGFDLDEKKVKVLSQEMQSGKAAKVVVSD